MTEKTGLWYPYSYQEIFFVELLFWYTPEFKQRDSYKSQRIAAWLQKRVKANETTEDCTE